MMYPLRLCLLKSKVQATAGTCCVFVATPTRANVVPRHLLAHGLTLPDLDTCCLLPLTALFTTAITGRPKKP
ncbi:uncharacterized protein B0T23DRAFT_370667 [Neurospora hispaniola]|uniref:Uncharacterized protein n=1 Tax=Neurospora hispaniola TaxID=588809 RepID=A0AAJ0IGA2_9PEZI|nr:hypothetical protein B0T23DRAFT_370667 [Neurospora hispaniola]